MIDAAILPPGFEDLQPLCARWANESINDRAAARLASTFEELKSVYDQLIGRADAALRYLDDKPIEALTDSERRLAALMLALAHISIAVEVQQQVWAPNTAPPFRVRVAGGVRHFG